MFAFLPTFATLTTPSPEISYKVITIMYASCLLIGVFFLALQTYLQHLGKHHWAFDNMEQIEGVWIIFAPFLPGVVWAGNMMRMQGMIEVVSEKDAKDKKKD